MINRQRDGRSPWGSARPELAIAGAALAACAISAYAVAGSAATVLVVLIFSALSLVVVNRLLAPVQAPPLEPEIPTGRRLPTGSFINYWRWRTDLTDAMGSMASYHAKLGPDLEHLLAARLSERHGVSLYHEPEVARSLLCARPRDLDLWAWVDPGRPMADRLDGPGIPPQTLARLVQRLEQL
ncbi:MAG: hypothetical protein ABSE77_07890 [Acidimicrobiales bacterium]|jgi:hypothetical protein